MRRTVIFFSAISILLIFSGYSFSQTLAFSDEVKKEQKLWGNYFVSGIIGTRYLFDDINGEKNLFLSQFNLKEGLNIGQISFQAYRNPEKKGFFDLISLDVKGFGAEPYGRAAFRLEKRNIFSLSGGYTERKYFADVASFVNPLFEATSDEGSFHTWNTKEKSFNLNGRLKAADWLSFDAFWQRTKLEGSSTTTLRLLNNEFPLNEPLNQTSNVIRLGTDLNIKNKIFYKISGLYQKFELDQTASSGKSVGIRGLTSGSSAIYLTSQSRQSAVDLDTWALSQSIHIIPYERVTVDGSFTKSWTDGKTSANESIKGRFIWPLYDLVHRATYVNAGKLKKDFNQGDLALSFQILPQLRARAGYDYYKYKIENRDDLNYSFTRTYYNKTVSESQSSSPLIQMKLDKFFVDADLTVGKIWTASLGYAHSTNKLDLREDEEEEGEEEIERYSYKLDSVYGSLAVKISKEFSLKTSFERGNYNKAFARLVPLELTSLRLQGNFNLENGLSGFLFYKYQKLENSKFSYSSSLNGYGGNLRFQNKNGLLGAFIHLSRNDFSSSMQILRFISLFIETEDISKYASDTFHSSLGLWLKKGFISLNGGYSYTKTKGTFPVRMEFPYLTAAFRVIPDFDITFNYRFYNHKQINYLSQNYKAHLFYIGFLYGF